MQKTAIGNDIVDLRQSDYKPTERFLCRVFSERERCLIQNSTDSNLILWKIWSAKEAAFKALKKLNPELVFAHRFFEVFEEGLVVHPLRTCSVKWRENLDWVHCLAFTDSNLSKQIIWCESHKRMLLENSVGEASDTESQLGRKFALSEIKLDRRHELSIARELVAGTEQAPKVLRNGVSISGLDLSLSHDGNYVAFAVLQDDGVSIAC